MKILLSSTYFFLLQTKISNWFSLFGLFLFKFSFFFTVSSKILLKIYTRYGKSQKTRTHSVFTIFFLFFVYILWHQMGMQESSQRTTQKKVFVKTFFSSTSKLNSTVQSRFYCAPATEKNFIKYSGFIKFSGKIKLNL